MTAVRSQFAAFWVVFLMIVSCQAEVGGALPTSAMKAVQADFLAVSVSKIDDFDVQK